MCVRLDSMVCDFAMRGMGKLTAVEVHLCAWGQSVDARLYCRESLFVWDGRRLPGHQHEPMLWTTSKSNDEQIRKRKPGVVNWVP